MLTVARFSRAIHFGIASKKRAHNVPTAVPVPKDFRFL